MPKITKKLKLDLTKIPERSKNRVKKDIGKYLKRVIKKDLEEMRSSVTGRKFKLLSKNYKEFKRSKGKPAIPNLKLTGDMQRALEIKLYKSQVEIGVWDSKEAAKADGHCNHSGKSTLQRRPFIPKPKENFRPDIRKGVKRIIKENEV